MLRIAVITYHFPSPKTPTDGRVAYEVIRILAKTNLVRVFVPLAEYPRTLSRVMGRTPEIDESFKLQDVDAQFHFFPTLPLLSRPFNGLVAARTLLPHVEAFAPELIYSIFLYPCGYSALLIGKRLGVPVVVEGVGSDVHSIGDPISKYLTRKVLRNSDYLFTVSESLRQLALPMGADANRSKAIISGCDRTVFRVRDRQEARAKLQIDPGAELVTYVGRMDLRKGLRELVKAAASLHGKRPGLRVFLVGNGQDKGAVQEEIHSCAAEKYVLSLPGCSFDEVADWMTAADIVTLPSYAEGCPNTILEALACGRPVVATNVGGIPEILNSECGYTVAPRDVGALANALDRALDRDWDADAISRSNGRSWAMAASERMQVLEAIAAGRETAPHGLSEK